MSPAEKLRILTIVGLTVSAVAFGIGLHAMLQKNYARAAAWFAIAAVVKPT